MAKCYVCKNEIDKQDILRIDTTKEGDKKKSHRNVHKKCEEEYHERMRERRELDQLYDYIKQEVMRYPKEAKLSKYYVNRLQGIRSGEYAVSRNQKVSLSENGYPYNVILLTFKIKKMDIINAISNKKFNKETLMIDYIIAIIQNNINDVYFRLLEKEKSDKRVEEIKIEYKENKFKNKTSLEENKVAKKLKHLF
ncbi:hypothetical protein P4571_08505 [Niallia alba]|uniref:hypothetical protein n=1 Tax=Niallia alba TaxID=2729105 RepID=UPI002E20961B|nr:hypothetical protein [Niallia alba]